MTNRRKVGTTSSHHGPRPGYTRAMARTDGCQPARGQSDKLVVVRIGVCLDS